MPRGIYPHAPGQGFLKTRHAYTVMIGATTYYAGFSKRGANHAFGRAQKPCKGSPAPAADKRLMMFRDGTLIRERDCNGTGRIE